MKGELTAQWPSRLSDPIGGRTGKPRTSGQTMVIDKGLGRHALEDLLQTAGSYIHLLKVGFGTSPLYNPDLLYDKIKLAKSYGLVVYPGGTMLEVAIRQRELPAFFQMARLLGFNGLEVSDGTIDVSRALRSELIIRGLEEGWTVMTEYGKKSRGSAIQAEQLAETVMTDIELGASLVTVEGRESGQDVGIYDERGACKEHELEDVLRCVRNPSLLLWEAPHKEQQVELLRRLGVETHLGNIAPQDVMSLEALRRGLRSDTLLLGEEGDTAKTPAVLTDYSI